MCAAIECTGNKEKQFCNKISAIKDVDSNAVSSQAWQPMLQAASGKRDLPPVIQDSLPLEEYMAALTLTAPARPSLPPPNAPRTATLPAQTTMLTSAVGAAGQPAASRLPPAASRQPTPPRDHTCPRLDACSFRDSDTRLDSGTRRSDPRSDPRHDPSACGDAVESQTPNP